MKHPTLFIRHPEELDQKGPHTSPKSEKVKIAVKLTDKPVTRALAKTSCFLASFARYAKRTGAIVAVKTMTKRIRIAVMSAFLFIIIRGFFVHNFIMQKQIYISKEVF